MRALFTLIKRQIVDNAIYLVAATLTSLLLILVAIAFAFTYDFQEIRFYKIAYFIWLPVYLAIGFCVLGVSHSYTDRTKGISAMLSILPVTSSHIFFAHILIVYLSFSSFSFL